MARMGKVSAGDLKKLQQELNKIEQKMLNRSFLLVRKN